jgi:hypothetical protein
VKPSTKWIIALGCFLAGNLSLVLGWCWINSAHYRQQRFAYLLDNPSEIFSVNPLLLAGFVVMAGLVIFGLVWGSILTVRKLTRSSIHG